MTKTETNFFAQNMEKIILGVGLLVLLVIAFLFLIRDPYKVEIRTVRGLPKEVGPAGVEGVVEDAVETLNERMASDKLEFEVPEIPNYTAALASAYERAPVGLSQFAKLGGHGTDVGGRIDGDREPWILPDPPMPLQVVASADYGLLEFDEIEDPDLLSGLQKVVGNQTPADIRYVSVEAIFDMDVWRQRFERIPLQQRVPDVLYRNSMFVTGTYLIRQTQDPISKRWGETTRITPVDGRLHYLPDPDRKFDRAAGEDAVRLVKTAQREIARPPFFPLDPVRPWTEPSAHDAQLTLEQQEQVNTLTRKINSLERRIEIQRRRLGLEERRPRPGEDFEERPGREFEIPFGDERPPPGRRPPSRRAPAPAGGGNNAQAQLTEMEAEMAELERRRDAIRAGRDPDAEPMPGEMMGPDQRMPPEMLEGLTPEQIRRMEMGEFEQPGVIAGFEQQSSGQVEVWAHDLTVEPGRTYRYKVVATVLNPLFQNRQLPEEQAQENQHRISLAPTQIEIEAADWSDPVKVEPKYHFFAVSGNAAAQSAEVLVFTIFNGAMQVETFQVQPGDPIGQVVERTFPDGSVHKLDLRVGAVMVDIVSAPGGVGLSGARMLYLDPQTNRIAARDVNQDKNSRRLKELRFEVNEAEQVQAQARAEPEF
ncbi:MAG: hypothetical protein GVY24_01370 [Planctomycetes bacterium]|jgi:hypothetical protein|nr:hypothetical protein [Planctomycetota bacterium]